MPGSDRKGQELEETERLQQASERARKDNDSVGAIVLKLIRMTDPWRIVRQLVKTKWDLPTRSDLVCEGKRSIARFLVVVSDLYLICKLLTND